MRMLVLMIYIKILNINIIPTIIMRLIKLSITMINNT